MNTTEEVVTIADNELAHHSGQAVTIFALSTHLVVKTMDGSKLLNHWEAFAGLPGVLLACEDLTDTSTAPPKHYFVSTQDAAEFPDWPKNCFCRPGLKNFNNHFGIS